MNERFIRWVLVAAALVLELAAMAVTLGWFDGNWQALATGGLAAYFGSIFFIAVSTGP